MDERLDAVVPDLNDNDPNRMNQYVSFAEYREVCDSYEGIMRTGICDADTYAEVASDERTVSGVIDGVNAPILAREVILSGDGGDAAEHSDVFRAVAPLNVIPESLRPGVVAMRQFNLEPGDVTDLLNPQPNTRRDHEDIAKMLEEKTGEKLAEGNGEAQFMVLTEYDTSACGQMVITKPEPIITSEGHTLTTDKETILGRLPELVELHEAVFQQQAAQVGYYDGLSSDMIQTLLDDDRFIGAAAFHKETGEALMFAIFAHDLEATEQVPWINRQKVEALMDVQEDAPKPIVGMPMVITAKYSGLGVFNETTSLAMHEVLYRTKNIGRSFLLYSANLQSILYTPRIMNSSLLENGALLKNCIMEASVLTELETAQ